MRLGWRLACGPADGDAGGAGKFREGRDAPDTGRPKSIVKKSSPGGAFMGHIGTAVAAPQHLRALEHANRVRLARASLKRDIAAGSTTAAQVVIDMPWEVESMSVSELLMSQRRWGRARCRRLLLSLGIAENKRIGTMTLRQ